MNWVLCGLDGVYCVTCEGTGVCGYPVEGLGCVVTLWRGCGMLVICRGAGEYWISCGGAGVCKEHFGRGEVCW